MKDTGNRRLLLAISASLLLGFGGAAHGAAPIVNAGGPYTAQDTDGDGFATITLNGTATDPDGGNITWYTWKDGSTRFAKGPDVNVVDAEFSVGTHTIELSAKDSQSEWATSPTTTVTIEAGGGNTTDPLTPNTGTYPTPAATDVDGDGVETITLNGSASTGDIDYYQWKNSGVSIAWTQTPTVDVDLPVGTHPITLSLRAVDGTWSSASAPVDITIEGGTPGITPLSPNPGTYANPAAVDTDGDGFATVTLNGSASTGDIDYYQWKDSGVSLVWSQSPTANIELPVGTHSITLTLQATDGTWSAPSDPVSITIDPDTPSTNTAYNVLFIGIDDFRTEMTAYNSTLKIQTPNLDEFANQAMLFERAYCQQAVCSASRASLMAGVRPDTTNVKKIQDRLRTKMPNAYTVAQLFKDNGYTTRSLGKIFHDYKEDDAYSWSEPAWKAPRSLHQDSSSVQVDGKMPATEIGDDSDINDESYQDGGTKNKAISLLRDYKASGEKFFLAVGFNKPHLPFCAPVKYWNMYDRNQTYQARYTDWPIGMPSYAKSEGWELSSYWDTDEYVYNETTNPHPPVMPESKIKELIHGYYACVSYVDEMVGQVIDELDALGLRDNTIIVLWGDHGWKLNDYGGWSKQTNFEIDTRVPLLIDVPGLDSGRTDALVELVDMYPTVAELCGLTPPANYCEGSSMVPVLKNPSIEWKAAAFSQYHRAIWDGQYNRSATGFSIRSGDWRYTEWWLANGTYWDNELYLHIGDDDLVSDENVAQYFPDVTSDLSNLMHREEGGSLIVGGGWKTIKDAL